MGEYDAAGWQQYNPVDDGKNLRQGPWCCLRHVAPTHPIAGEVGGCCSCQLGETLAVQAMEPAAADAAAATALNAPAEEARLLRAGRGRGWCERRCVWGGLMAGMWTTTQVDCQASTAPVHLQTVAGHTLQVMAVSLAYRSGGGSLGQGGVGMVAAAGGAASSCGGARLTARPGTAYCKNEAGRDGRCVRLGVGWAS